METNLIKKYSMVDVTAELYRIFDLLNKSFFESKLEQPFILVHTKRKAYGTFWSKSWINKTQDLDLKNEITINPEYLNRSIEETVGTLIHEMVHLYNHINTILQDSTKELIKSFNINEELFLYYRRTLSSKERVKLIRNKYQCKCGHKLNSSKELNIICGDCKTNYEKV